MTDYRAICDIFVGRFAAKIHIVNAIQAGKAMLKRIRELIADGLDLAIGTTPATLRGQKVIRSRYFTFGSGRDGDR